MAVTIQRLGRLGDGIGPGEGDPVYAARTLPGEVVDGPRVEGRISPVKIVTPVPERVRPPCPHYAGCGGCALQHASDDFVAEWKRGIVVQALAAQGVQTDVRPTLTSPAQSRRRATFAVRRTKAGALIGFHGPASDIVVDTPECRLVTPALVAARPALQALARIGASRKSALRVSVTSLDNGLDLAVTGGKPLDMPMRAALGSLLAAHGIVRLTWEGEPVAQAERPILRIDGIAVSPPPGAFLQATDAAERTLRQTVREAVGPATRIADLFAGIGTFALPLARDAELHAVEGDPEMTEALGAAWRGADGLKRITTEVRDLFRRPLLPEDLNRFDAVVIDPPRAGAEAQAAELARSDVARIAYVSCNPVTFARDVRVLTAGGYRLEWVQVVDQFRWSPHVEVAGLLTRAHMPA